MRIDPGRQLKFTEVVTSIPLRAPKQVVPCFFSVLNSLLTLLVLIIPLPVWVLSLGSPKSSQSPNTELRYECECELLFLPIC